MGLGCVRRGGSPPMPLMPPPSVSSSTKLVDLGRLCLGDNGGGGGGGVLPTRNLGIGEVGRLGAAADGASTPRPFPCRSGGTSRADGFGGDRGDSTRNDGGDRGGGGLKVLYTESGLWRAGWPWPRGRVLLRQSASVVAGGASPDHPDGDSSSVCDSAGGSENGSEPVLEGHGGGA